MIKKGLIFFILQAVALLFSLFVLSLGLAGSHGNLSFSNGGRSIALIITIVLILPLLYLLIQRQKLQHRKLYFSIAVVLFILAMLVIYVGFPGVTKRFTVSDTRSNTFPVSGGSDLRVNISLQPEMFNRVLIEANVQKEAAVDVKQLNVVVMNDKKQIVPAVFSPLAAAWDSLHYETQDMNSFFEKNAITERNRFQISAQYAIEKTDSLYVQVVCEYVKNGQRAVINKRVAVGITSHLVMERLIKY